MYFVYQKENRYDSHIGLCFGPFDTKEEAACFAYKEEMCSSNFNGERRIYYYYVKELIKS